MNPLRSPHLTHRCLLYPRENHYSVPFQSLRDGLLFVFSGYDFPLRVFLDHGNGGILSHYKQFTERAIAPPGKVINRRFCCTVSSRLIRQSIAEVNEAYYPTSVVTYNSLGDAYKLKGDKEAAIRYHGKALVLDAANEKAAAAIKELK